MSKTWRVGKKVPLNVYEGDRPVCPCHSAEDAARIVEAVNADRWLPIASVPKDGSEVLTTNGTSICVDFYDETYGWCLARVTHWRPAPKLPGESDD